MNLRSNFALRLATAALLIFCSTLAAAAESVHRARLPVQVEDGASTDMDVLIGPAPNQVQIKGDSLIDALRSWVDPQLLGRVQQPWASLEDIRALGLSPEYDEANLRIRIFVPALNRRTNEVSITRRTQLPFNTAQTSAPSTLSAFINAYASQELRYGGDTPQAYGSRQPFNSAFDSAINLDGWVAEGYVNYSEPFEPTPGSGWTRGDVRFVKDQPSSMTRYSLGDTSYPVSGFQQSRLLGGLSAVSNFSLQPYRLTTPVNNFEIALRSRSMVRVFMNGRLVQTLNLPAGRHDIRDLPFSVGVNDVQLEITDAAGRVEFMRIPYVYSDSLLGQGIHQLAYALGYPVKNDAYVRMYDNKKATLNLSHRYGFSNTLSFGGYFQGDPDQGIAGLNGVIATSIGNWTIEPAVSKVYRSNDSSLSPALRLGYVYTDYKGPDGSQRNLGLGIEARSPGFAVLGDLTDNPLAAYNLTAGYTQQIFKNTGINFALSESIHPSGDSSLAQRWSGTLGLSRTWFTGLDTQLSFSMGRDSAGSSQNSAFFFLTWAFPEKRQYVSATASTDNGYGRLQWNYNPTFNMVGGYNVQAGMQRSDTDKQVDGQVDYTGNRGKMTLRQEAVSSDSTGTVHRTTLRASAALAFAGGRLGISRPVTDSFVLVKPTRAMSGEIIQLNRQAPDQYAAEANWLGPAIAPELVSYHYYQLHLTAPNARPGQDLERENYVLFPTYKSGTLLLAGANATAFVRGTLLDSKGSPLGLWSGEIRSLDDPTFVPLVLFTNREGVFGVDGMRPGNYEAKAFDETQGSIRFKVPDNAQGLFDVGKLRQVKHE